MGLKTLIANLKYLTKNKINNDNNSILLKILDILSNDYHIFFIPNLGFGETVILATLINQYKKLYKKKIIFFCVNKSRKLLYQLFNNIDFVDEISSNDYLKFHKLINHNSYKNIKIIENPYKKHNRKITTMVDIMKASLNLPEDSKLDSLNIEDDYIYKIKNDYASLNLEDNYDKNILIIPEALCLGNNIVPKNFWKNFSRIMKEKGYNVIFNTELDSLKEENCIYPNIKEFLGLSNYFKYIVGVRTGLFDVLANYNKKSNMIVIYPNKNNDCWKNNPAILDGLYKYFDIKPSNDFVQDYIQCSSLQKMFEINACEIIYSSETLNKIIEIILSNKDSK